MGRPDSLRIFLPSRTFVPSSRTPAAPAGSPARRGDDALGDHVAAHDAAEDIDQDALDLAGSDRISLKAVVTRSFEAPPPTSRKFAGFAAAHDLMMSMVAMASPAPFTMQPILPSSLT